MMIAVAVFNDIVSPRLDIADNLWIYYIEQDKKIATFKEKCKAACERPDRLIGLLKEKGIKTVVCGGCPHFFLRMLAFNGVEVIPGVIGDPDQAVNRLAQGETDLTSPGPLPGGSMGRYCRHRCRNSGGNKLKNNRR
jgi:predicted Fe-Mo cluster-binding NifX family protein